MSKPKVEHPSLPLASNALQQIAQFYGEGLDKLKLTVGHSLTPERVVVSVMDRLLAIDGSVLRWCAGYGKEAPCHFWTQPRPGSGDFERRCDVHPERREKERRRSVQ